MNKPMNSAEHPTTDIREAEGGELDDAQLDAVSGGNPILVTVAVGLGTNALYDAIKSSDLLTKPIDLSILDKQPRPPRSRPLPSRPQ